MTTMELMRCIGQVKGTYILEAKDMTAPKISRRPRRMLLVAVIAMLLLLVGCAVVYALRLQDLSVGTYQSKFDQVPEMVDEFGNVLPAKPAQPEHRISVQNAHQEALAQWIAFQNEYDPDGAIMAQVDRSHGALLKDIPEAYYLTYDCYTQEMVQKLEEISREYQLKLLSQEEYCAWDESDILFKVLDIPGVVLNGHFKNVEYLDSGFYQEGTFSLSLLFSLENQQWPYEDNTASYRYSKKEYFDPHTWVFDPEESLEQWDYTRQDGTAVLLILGEEWAGIMADMSDAFVSISLSRVKWDQGEAVKMPRQVLEEIAEGFDLSIRPKAVDMTKLEQLRQEAEQRRETERAAARKKLYSGGYQNYVEQKIAAAQDQLALDRLTYALYDVNNDGVEELLANNYEILSMEDGQSYVYFSANLPAIPQLYVCADQVIEIEDYITGSRYYFQAQERGTTFLQGLKCQNEEWSLLTDISGPNSDQWPRQALTKEQAQEIMDSHPRIEIPTQLMKRYGEPIREIHYSDPYAQYLAKALDQFEDAKKWGYTLMDLNGDGTKELLCKNQGVWDDETNQWDYRQISVYTIRHGELYSFNRNFGGHIDAVCKQGILSYYNEQENYYQFFRITGTEVQNIEWIWFDPTTGYWNRDADGEGPEQPCVVSQEAAREYLSAYERIPIRWKPYEAYPFN